MNSSAERVENVDDLLNELERLSRELSPEQAGFAPVVTELPSDEAVYIPTLTEVVDHTCNTDPELYDPAEEQHQLFEDMVGTPPQAEEEDVDAIVDAIVAKLMPKVEAQLRERVLQKIMARKLKTKRTF